MTENNTPISLLEYTRNIRNVLSAHPGVHGVWVVAEISDVNRHPSGHCYMELLQKDERGVTVAKMRATIWKFILPKLEKKFQAVTARRFDNGMKLMLRLEANMHEVYSISANVLDIDPSYTMGDMERIRREILANLSKEGILNLNKEKPIPLAPQRIAVISAAGAAGYGDFVNQLSSTPEQFAFYPLLFPATLQGNDTSASVRYALQRIEMSIDFWDVVIIIRGGGATTDLNGFDDYLLAKAVATFPIPVIVGIGHERDRTVLDEIACVRCKTPTAVAAYIIDAMRNAENIADNLVNNGLNAVRQRLSAQHELLARAETIIPELPLRRLNTEKLRLDSAMQQVVMTATGMTANAMQRLKLIPDIIRNAVGERLRNASERLEALEKMTNILSPANTLARGYSISRVNGRALRNAGQLKPGDVITTQLHDGTLQSTVTNITANPKTVS
ncbi:MAG: exodeoxyribonuclease VII large subunit [Muribaculaceae bacterium]|nr:exodeoxyribonuclease VII large subunit [Muribaculaceae bacterium]